MCTICVFGMLIAVYRHVYWITKCDSATRDYFVNKLGIDLNWKIFAVLGFCYLKFLKWRCTTNRCLHYFGVSLRWFHKWINGIERVIIVQNIINKWGIFCGQLKWHINCIRYAKVAGFPKIRLISRPYSIS